MKSRRKTGTDGANLIEPEIFLNLAAYIDGEVWTFEVRPDLKQGVIDHETLTATMPLVELISTYIENIREANQFHDDE